MEKELFNDVDEKVALDSQTIGSNTTTVGNIIDTVGFESLLFLVSLGNWTDGTFTVKLEEGDDSGLSDAADVPAAQVLGTLPALGADNAIGRVGSIGKKRYQRLSIVTTGVTTGSTGVSAQAVLAHPKHAPVSQ
jgi:hypothetical protein